MHLFQKHRSGFTAIEIVIVLSTIVLTTGLAIPTYRDYIIRNDLEIAVQNVSQGIQRAQFLSQVAMNDAEWGFSTDAVPGRGVIFMGSSYATRDTDFDELYSLPSTIAISGITEVSFSKIDGTPNQIGTITLTALNGEQRVVDVSLGDDGVVQIPQDWMTICFDPGGDDQETMDVPDSLWEYYSGLGAELGECGSGSGGSLGGEGGDTGGIDVDADDENDEAAPDTPGDGDYTCTVDVLGADLNPNGYDMMITYQNKQNGGGWNEPFGDFNKAVDGNINTGDPTSASCGSSYPDLDPFRIRVQSWEKKKSWYDGTSNNDWKALVTINESGDDDNAYVLTNGDPVPNHSPLQSPATIQDYLAPYINLDTDTMVMSDDEAIWLFELGTNSPSINSDFQDLVVKLTYTEE